MRRRKRRHAPDQTIPGVLNNKQTDTNYNMVQLNAKEITLFKVILKYERSKETITQVRKQTWVVWAWKSFKMVSKLIYTQNTSNSTIGTKLFRHCSIGNKNFKCKNIFSNALLYNHSSQHLKSFVFLSTFRSLWFSRIQLYSALCVRL